MAETEHTDVAHLRPVRRMHITLTVNREPVTREVDVRTTLADFLRHDLRLTGTHVGCEQGVCGACTVLVDGTPMRSCILYAVQGAGHEIDTVEGLSENDELHPVQAAFLAHHALQCGFCTAGFIMTTVEFLRREPNPTRAQVREALSGSLCRCTGYQAIIDAVMSLSAGSSGGSNG